MEPKHTNIFFDVFVNLQSSSGLGGPEELPRLTQLMRMYRGSAALGSFRLQKPYITLLLSKVSVISAKPPPVQQSSTISQRGQLAAAGWTQNVVTEPVRQGRIEHLMSYC